jgi:hypothetical protein
MTGCTQQFSQKGGEIFPNSAAEAQTDGFLCGGIADLPLRGTHAVAPCHFALRYDWCRRQCNLSQECAPCVPSARLAGPMYPGARVSRSGLFVGQPGLSMYIHMPIPCPFACSLRGSMCPRESGPPSAQGAAGRRFVRVRCFCRVCAYLLLVPILTFTFTLYETALKPAVSRFCCSRAAHTGPTYPYYPTTQALPSPTAYNVSKIEDLRAGLQITRYAFAS